MRMLLLWLGVMTGAAGAKALKQGSKSEVRADYELICNAVQRSGAAAETDPSQ